MGYLTHNVDLEIPGQALTTQMHPEFGMKGHGEDMLEEDLIFEIERQKFTIPRGTSKSYAFLMAKFVGEKIWLF